MQIYVIILTKNEEAHIQRCIQSVASFATKCIVVDSGSTDETVALAEAAGADVLFHEWLNYADQMNWGIKQVPNSADWVFRLDADEIVTPALAAEITKKLPKFSDDINGVFVNRRMCFLGKQIRWGGVFPIRVLRLFRPGKGHCEIRWMDEHIVVSGNTENVAGEIIDDNKKSLSWWTEKHNSYASREVVDILNAELRFMPAESIAGLDGGQAGIKRWIKENIYSRLPFGSRALLYFMYRYFIRLGFMDGKRGSMFHILQGYWYRYLVDAKLFEVRSYMKATGSDPEEAIRAILGIDVFQRTPD